MAQLAEVARDHAALRRRLGAAAAGEASRLWGQVDRDRIGPSWLSLLPRLLLVLVGAQQAVAGQADDYLDEVLDAQGVDPAAEGRVVAAALSGVASDGRDLADLLYQPAIRSLVGIQRGATVDQALAGGRAGLDMIVRTQVADAGRVADQLATAVRPAVTGYVRMLVGDSCSRCAILAGRHYRWNAGFDRHPRCDCIGIPASEDTADDLRTDPMRYFNSLDPAEQDRIFTKAGAEAIRDGADMARVVNARRGMYTAGGRKFTTEATTRRGIGRSPRIMPEQIYLEAGGDRDEALRLLRLHGYITGRPTRISRPVEPPSPHPGIDKLPRIVRPDHLDPADETDRELILNRDARETNPGYGQPGYDINCVHVVATHELRRRGYDVTATPLPEPLRPNRGRDHFEAIRRWRTPDGKLREPKFFSAAGAVAKELESWPDGARGWVRIGWAKKYGGGGHIFNVEKINGEVRYLDAQNSRAMLDFKRDYASRATRGPYAFDVTRVDDLTPTDDVLEFVQER